MARNVSVHLLPSHFSPEQLEGGIAVVIDVLRATTTLAYAFQNGMSRVVPCETVDEARDVRARLGDHILLGGERGGEMIPGFDLDNSPKAWSADAVADREVAFTTTNGTRALLHSVRAERVITAAFANRTAVVRQLQSSEQSLHLVCAGTDGNVAIEDCLCAGAIVDALIAEARTEIVTNDSALLTVQAWREIAAQDKLHETLRSGAGGINVSRIGRDRDIEIAARLDQVDLVPEYLPQSRDIRPVA